MKYTHPAFAHLLFSKSAKKEQAVDYVHYVPVELFSQLETIIIRITALILLVIAA